MIVQFANPNAVSSFFLFGIPWIAEVRDYAVWSCAFLSVASAMCHCGHPKGRVLDQFAIAHVLSAAASLHTIDPRLRVLQLVYFQTFLLTTCKTNWPWVFAVTAIGSQAHYRYVHRYMAGRFLGLHKYFWHAAQGTILAFALRN